MAADSAEICGGLVTQTLWPKITRLVDGGLVASAGFSADCFLVAKWFLDGMPEKQPDFLGSEVEDRVDTLWLKPDGTVWRNSKGVCAFYPESPTTAIGAESARVVTEAAMRLGKSAAEAVELAVEMCANIYGPVQVERLSRKDM